MASKQIFKTDLHKRGDVMALLPIFYIQSIVATCVSYHLEANREFSYVSESCTSSSDSTPGLFSTTGDLRSNRGIHK